MKLNTSAHDLCTNCHHEFEHHGRDGCEFNTMAFERCQCRCNEFVPPIVGRLRDALAMLFRVRGHGLDLFWIPTIREEVVANDLLVECGLVVKDGESFRWKESVR